MASESEPGSRGLPLLKQAALVTGASGAVGQSIALALASAGADLVLVARGEAGLQETAHAARGRGRRAHLLVGDVTDPATAERAVAVARRELGRLDVLVNNAGTNVQTRQVARVAPEDWQRVIDVNLNAVYYFTHAALPALRERGGTIVNILSWSAQGPAYWAGAAYLAAKRGALGLTDVVNAEERHRGVRACAVLPGEIDTPHLDRRPVPPAPEVRAHMLTPSDVAAAVLYAVCQPTHVNVEQIVLRPRHVRDLEAEFKRVIDADV